MAQYEEGDIKAGQALRKIADRVVKAALAGDKDARQEIANRLDGRPTEHVHQYRHDSVRDLDDAELLRLIKEEDGLGGVADPQGSAGESSVVH